MQRLLLALCALLSVSAFAQYTPAAGQNTPAAAYIQTLDKETGKVELRRDEKQPVSKDTHGNARGNQYDLAVDGAFDGQTVLIINQVGYGLTNMRASLKEKGLSSVMYSAAPPAAELEQALAKSCQLWLLANTGPSLTPEHLTIIKEFFDAGHGVYIWGDNDPYYVDANRLASALVPGLRMEGNLYGNNKVNVADGKGAKVGLRAGHLITTGLEHLYEGITIATIQFNKPDGRNAALYDGKDGGNRAPDPSERNDLSTRAPSLPEGFTPLLYGSAGNLVTVAYEREGKRLVMDGGFTRLEVSWDEAGTARYVKNAAAWLVHSERFKETVASKR